MPDNTLKIYTIMYSNGYEGESCTGLYSPTKEHAQKQVDLLNALDDFNNNHYVMTLIPANEKNILNLIKQNYGMED